jgi:hypothetical protein
VAAGPMLGVLSASRVSIDSRDGEVNKLSFIDLNTSY